jgi:hypothetical protein
MARYDNERHLCWECDSRASCKYLAQVKSKISDINETNWQNNIDIGVGPLISDCSYFTPERIKK